MKRGRILILSIIVLTLLSIASVPGYAQSDDINPLLIVPPDIVLINGNIATVDDDFSFAEAIAIRGDRILAVGTNDEIQSLVMDGTQVIDVNGRTVLPGLIDGTLHGIRNGYHCYTQAVRLDTVSSRAEALEMYRAKGEELGPGVWVFTSGGWNVNALDEPGMFTLAELDEALPNNPVVVRDAFFNAQVNSAALAELGVTADTPNPENGEYMRDEDGNLTGGLRGAPVGALNALINFPQGSIDYQMDCLENFIRDANMRGLTSWDDPGGNDPYDPMRRTTTWQHEGHAFQAVNHLWLEGRLNARIVLHMTTYDGNEQVINDTHRSLTLLGDDMLKLGGPGEEIYAASHSGANEADFDVQEFTDRYMPIVEYLAMNRWQFEHHSSSAYSNEILLAVWENVNETYPITDLNWSILHPEDPSEESLERFGALNVNVVTGMTAAIRPGLNIPYRRIYDSSANLCQGSDAMNVAPWPPFVNLWFSSSGQHMDPAQPGISEDQRLTREEALRSMTVNCGRLVELPGEVGSLQPGWYADLIVLSDDYFTVEDAEVKNLTSVLTIVDGRIVYSDAEFAGMDG